VNSCRCFWQLLDFLNPPNATGWSKETVDCNISLTEPKKSKTAQTQWFLETLYWEVLVFWCPICLRCKLFFRFRVVTKWCYGSILQGLRTQIPQNTSERLQFPWMPFRYPQIPIRHPTYTPQTPPRHIQGARNVNRRQQTPPDVLKQHLSVSLGVWSCLFVSGGVCCCLLASPAPWRCMVGVWGMSGESLGVSEWYSWKSEGLGCVWGYLGSQSLQYGAVTPLCHNPETKE